MPWNRLTDSEGAHMPRSSQNKSKRTQEIMPTSRKLDAIDHWLQKMLNAFPAKGTITPEEIQDWHRDLAHFSEAAIDYAFDTHRRNAIFFPVYGMVIDLCISYEPPVNEYHPSPENRKLYGTTYNSNDFFWMLIKLNAPGAVGPLRAMRKKPPTVEEWNRVLDECDRKRSGGAPERAAEFRR
jgi:hypothetical protein